MKIVGSSNKSGNGFQNSEKERGKTLNTVERLRENAERCLEIGKDAGSLVRH